MAVGRLSPVVFKTTITKYQAADDSGGSYHTDPNPSEV